MKKIFVLILFFFTFCESGILAQKNFLEKEKELKIIGDSILRGSNDSVRIFYNNLFNSDFEKLLNDSNSFNYSFDSLKNVSSITSKDKLIRIYNWILPAVSREKYSFFGFVQLYDKKQNKVTLFSLKEENSPPEEVERKSLTTQNWFGAVYYKIIESKIKGAKMYTLLGWRGNNLKTTMKVIDVLVINKGILKFGAPVFATDHGVKFRAIFEYTSQAVMSLRYNEKKKIIVFDHLSPSDPTLKGNYESYGPDMTYDGYKFQNYKWNLLKNIDVGNPGEFDVKTKNTTIKNKEFYKPEK